MELLYLGISFLFFWIVYFEQQRRNRAIQRASRYRAHVQRRQVSRIQQEDQQIQRMWRRYIYINSELAGTKPSINYLTGI